MLRRTLIAASQSERLRQLASDLPAARWVAERFVAGDGLDDAVAAARELNEAGFEVTLDHLGESVDDRAVAEAGADAYMEALDRIRAEGLRASVSVKPSQLGMEFSAALCEKLIGRICDRAAEVGTWVTIDMESSAHTDATVELLASLRAAGHDNVGCAIQSYLHRSVDDVRRLTALGASLRLCKGAYAEPSEIAYQDDAEIVASYLRCAEIVLDGGVYGRFATHDHRLIASLRNLVRRLEIPDDAYEFQMLYGVRGPLQRELLAAGMTVRIYVPYGDQWYPYFVRRLAERPANLLFFLRAVAGRR